MYLRGGGREAEAGEFDVDVGGQIGAVWDAVEGDGEGSGDGPVFRIHFNRKSTVLQAFDGGWGWGGEADGGDEGVIGEEMELVGIEGGDDAADVGELGGEGEGVGDGSVGGAIDGCGKLVTGEDFSEPIGPLGGGGEGVLGVDAKHSERKTPVAPSKEKTTRDCNLL
jgi:hypothetical protein